MQYGNLPKNNADRNVYVVPLCEVYDVRLQKVICGSGSGTEKVVEIEDEEGW